MRFFSSLFFAVLTLTPLGAAAQTIDAVNLPVPFIWEIPDGVWTKPWNNACEEASIMMLDQFYLNRKEENIGRVESKNLMRPLFAIEDKLYGSNADTNASRTLKLIDDYTNFTGELKPHPTIEEIVAELAQGHPVISFHYGYDLKNPHHRFRRGGSSYHVMVLTGFNATKNLFYANDTELKGGLDYPYTYDTIMASLHDFNHTSKKADGQPIVIFTRPKEIVRETPGYRIYLIKNGQKHYVDHPRVFKNHRWAWAFVKPMSSEALSALPDGEAISN